MHQLKPTTNSIGTTPSKDTLFETLTNTIKRACKPAPSRLTFLRIFSLLLFSTLPTSISFADSGATGTLLIHGNIQGDGNSPLELSIDSLKQLDSTTFTSSAPWTDAPTKYTGVRINTLLESIGAQSSTFKAKASNEYQFLLSDIDFDRYPIIVAYEKNGEVLSARTLGPFLIMFPFDDFPELLNEKNKAASVWQLTEMEIL